MIKEIYLAGGCFWGVEKYLSLLPGVVSTEAGYANGKTLHPTYEEVCYEDTGHAEAVKVEYDDKKTSLSELLENFYKVIDPTSKNKQGPDIGKQYRTGIYFSDPYDIHVIELSLRELQEKYEKPLAIEVLPLQNYYKAEGYHQDYLDKNPNGYCHISPKMFEFAKDLKMKNQKEKGRTEFMKPKQAELREKLTEIQYHVTQEKGTEKPYDNEYNAEFREGIYLDITTGEPLFISTDKFQSDCGWPSFSKPIDNSLLEEKSDNTFGMRRTEVRSKTGDSHLGHVFDDGPKELGGLRYCINSASLKFIPKEKMKQEGYERYLPLLERQ